MSGLLNRLRRDQSGLSAVEFALFLPVLLLLLVAIVNIGQVMTQANALEKALRNGALFAARNEFPLSASVITMTKNIVKRGDPNGTAAYLVAGWADPAAQLSVTTSDFTLGVDTVPVVRLSASVPFTPFLADVLSSIGFENYMIELTHEQAFVGL